MPRVGVAVRDCTPRAGLAMSGFAARTEPATGAHDPLTVRALAVDDTVLLTVDACGLHEDFCARVRAAIPGHSVVAATHTHGGPVTMPGRLGGPLDRAYPDALAATCVEAAHSALAAREPATIEVGVGPDPGIARNRRRIDGAVYAPLTVVRFRRPEGSSLVCVVNYPCHPVVLGADNRRWTADYPGTVRAAIEAAEPGSVGLFLTGCCGELNTGHSAHASVSVETSQDRTFEACERVGGRIAEAALAVPTRLSPAAGPARGISAETDLPLRAPDPRDTAASCTDWQRELPLAAPARQALLRGWISWAEDVAPTPMASWTARVTVLRWGGVRLVALPGEPFSETARDITARLPGDTLVIGYADGCPGYIPPAGEFAHGGYEVDEAHRYYGMPAPFAEGAAERLTELAVAIGGE
ncbi:hypothetical protein ACIRQP_32800 [Streptomyces sp. NPDC102274]|uniref:hypothetical protein n=1 Tax=Streptomyces sp. NPDC102274 TaxID=3366151 RepID=UPI0038180AC2